MRHVELGAPSIRKRRVQICILRVRSSSQDGRPRAPLPRRADLAYRAIALAHDRTDDDSRRRVGLALLFALPGWTEGSAVLQIVGDLEVSFFMVALFVALLIATLQLRHEDLLSARAEVQTLSGLLPICAWCKKVRDDDGYWRQVEVYFARRDHIQFTHGMCSDCLDEQKAPRKTAPASPAGV